MKKSWVLYFLSSNFHLKPTFWILWTRFHITKIVSRPPSDCQNLDMQKTEFLTAWMFSFVAECRGENKKDKTNTYGTVVYIHVLNLVPRMCG